MGVDHEGQKDPKDLDVAELEDAGSLPVDSDDDHVNEQPEPLRKAESSESDGDETPSDDEGSHDGTGPSGDGEALDKEEAEDKAASLEDELAATSKEPIADHSEDPIADSGEFADASEQSGQDEAGSDSEEVAPQGSVVEQAKASASAVFEKSKVALRRARVWCSGHQGASVAIGTCVALVIITGGFAIGASAVVAHIDADIAARAEERLADEERGRTEQLPRISMQFLSLSDGSFPEVSANLALSMPDGSPLPELSTDSVSVVERDAEDGEADVAISGFTFDPSTGSCQLVYSANTDTVAADRTVRIDLKKSSGYSGGASMSYHALIPSEGEVAQDSGEWMLPDSDTHRYTAAELSGYSKDDLFIARNEIFARHGRMFGDSYLQRYFEGKSWYEPRYSAEEFDSMRTPLNEIEIANVNTILSVERG